MEEMSQRTDESPDGAENQAGNVTNVAVGSIGKLIINAPQQAPTVRPRSEIRKDSYPENIRNEGAETEAPLLPVKATPIQDSLTGKNIFEIYKLDEHASAFFREGNYLQAHGKLVSLDEMRPADMRTMVRIAECQLHRERYNDALATIREIERKIFSVTPPGRTDIMKQAERCAKEKKYFRAVIFLHMACKFHQLKDTESDKYRVLEEALARIDQVSEIARSKDEELLPDYGKIFCNLILILAPDIEKSMESLMPREGDIYDDKKVLITLRSDGNQGDCLLYLHRYSEASILYKEGLEMLKAHFGRNVKELPIHAEFLHRLGSAYEGMERYDKAKSLWLRAEEAWGEAKGITPQQKNKRVNSIRKGLKALESSRKQV